MGITLLYSTSLHPKTDGKTKRKNQILEDMLCAIPIEWQGLLADHLNLLEFSYNNSYHVTFQMVAFKAFGPDLLLQMTEHVKLIRDTMKVAQDRQKSYADLMHCPEAFEVGDRVLLRMLPMREVVFFVLVEI